MSAHSGGVTQKTKAENSRKKKADRRGQTGAKPACRTVEVQLCILRLEFAT